MVRDQRFLRWLNTWASDASIVTSVCTGSAVLAAARAMDGAELERHPADWDPFAKRWGAV